MSQVRNSALIEREAVTLPLDHAFGFVERGDGVTAVPEKDIPRFATDADGIASIPIVKTGPHLLVIDHRVSPSATPDQANADLFNATLWFSVTNR